MINRVVNAACDGLMAPFLSVNPWAGLSAFSLIIAVVALLAFRFCSNQQAVARARERMFGISSTPGRIPASLVLYMKAYLLPVAILIIPVGLIIIQMSCWFGGRPYRPGEPGRISVTLRPDTDVMETPVTLSSAPGLHIEGESLRIPDENIIIWRFSATNSVDGWIDVQVHDEVLRKTVQIGDGFKKLSAFRISGGGMAALLNPAEPPIPNESPVWEIELDYPARDLLPGPLNVNWLVACFGLTILFAAALKMIFRAEPS
jgi:hypothetical protein